MKKILISLLVLAILLSGCGPAVLPAPTNPTEDPGFTDTTKPTEEPGSTDTTKPTEEPGSTDTTKPTEEPGSTDTTKPTEEPGSTDTTKPTEEPGSTDTTKPTEDPSTNPPDTTDPSACKKHIDDNKDEVCDICFQSVIIIIDFYSINDLHGKFVDNDTQIGVDELTTYLKNARKNDDYAFFLSAGDMWQGGAESNTTKGQIITDWMNALDFTSMTVGNHEFDWGSEYIKMNAEVAEFPFLAINIYDRATNQRLEYCDASVVVEAGGLQIGIIGAIGNHYNSIAADKKEDVYFKTGSELTSLVKAESIRLQNQGVDLIVYVIHSDEEDYDSSLSSGGYVDLVFEGHTHEGYCTVDSYGVYHLQNEGDNADGISHVEIAINSVTNAFKVQQAGQISKNQYQNLADDPIVEELLKKYESDLSQNYEVLGYNRAKRSSTALRDIISKLYYEAGVERWGKQYNIVLGGGSLNARSPYSLSVGDVTYAQLQSIFPFDNPLYLCTMKGSDLKARFLNNTEYREYCTLSINQIKDNEIYYVVADSWDALYSYNKMTVVEMYDPNVFARDLLAEYIKAGGLS